MNFQDLIHHFILMNKREPLHVNELLDYIQKSYIHGDLCIKDYKRLFRELNKRGAMQAEIFDFTNKSRIRLVYSMEG